MDTAAAGDGGIPVTMGSRSIASPGTLTPVSGAHRTSDTPSCPNFPRPSTRQLELETKVLPKVRNHEDGPNQGLLLVESSYYRFYI